MKKHGLRPATTETRYRLESFDRHLGHYTIQAVKCEDADQTVLMYRLVCVFLLSFFAPL